MSTNLVSSSWVFSWIRCSTSRPIPENHVSPFYLLRGEQQYSIPHTRIVMSYLESCSLRVMQEMTKEAYYESNLNISFVYSIITAIHNTVAPL